MNLLVSVFNLILYQPLFNVLILLYEYLPGRDFGVAIVVLTLLIRLVLYPSMAHSLRSQKALSELQPKIKEIQTKHKNDLAKQSQEMFALYREKKISPFSAIFPLLIQFPVLYALWRLLGRGFGPEHLTFLYSFVPNPGTIDPISLGFLNLAQPAAVLAVLAGILQFFQSKMVMPKTSGQAASAGDKAVNFSETLQKQMLYFFPVLTILILLRLPAAIGVYWITTTIFSIVQQRLVYKTWVLSGPGITGAAGRSPL